MSTHTYENMKSTLEEMYPRQVGKLMIKRLKKLGLKVDRFKVSLFFAGKIKSNPDKWLQAVKELTDEGATIIQQREEITSRFD